MADLPITGVVGAVSAAIGAVGAFFGLKTKTNNLEKRVDKLSEKVVFKDGCEATHEAIEKRFDTQEDMLTEIRGDIKTLIGKQ